MFTDEENAGHLWVFDDGVNTHYVFTSDHHKPCKNALCWKYGREARSWELIRSKKIKKERKNGV